MELCSDAGLPEGHSHGHCLICLCMREFCTSLPLWQLLGLSTFEIHCLQQRPLWWSFLQAGVRPDCCQLVELALLVVAERQVYLEACRERPIQKGASCSMLAAPSVC
jgi:hypothetical protein